MINSTLNTFASINEGEDVKLSIDGKKELAYSICDDGEENLSGFEKSPTFQDRKQRFKEEQNNVKLSLDIIKVNDKDADIIPEKLIN